MRHQAPRFQASTEVLPDGSFPFRVTVTKSMHEADEQPPVRAIFANGQGCDSGVVRRLIQGVAAEATDRGQAIEIATYDEPCVGTSAYGHDYRAGRLDTVAKYVLNDVLDDAFGIVVIGHSRGNIAALKMLDSGDAKAHIKGLVGYTPVWFGEAMHPGQFVGSMLKEAMHMPGLAAMGGLPSMVRVAYNGRGHSRNLTQSRFDIQSIFAGDMTEPTVQVSRRMATHMIFARRDGLVPFNVAPQRLIDHGYEGTISDIPTSHTGAVTAVNACARPLFNAVVEVAGLQSSEVLLPAASRRQTFRIMRWLSLPGQPAK